MKNFSYIKSEIAFTLAFAILVVPTLSSAATLYRQLELGMRGSDVGTLQTFLAQDATIYPQGLVTDYFGSLTKSAVSNFQARNGISTVGRVGPQTLGVINAQMGGGVIVNNSPARVISQTAISASSNQVTIAWNTSVGTVASIFYSQSPIMITEATDYASMAISGSIAAVSTDLRTSHTSTLSGLSSNTRYYYVVYVKDTQGNESISLPAAFETTN